MAIGNGDAHSKNYSLILRDGGEVLLAPLDDGAPTLLLYALSNNAGHAVAGQIRLGYITLEHLARKGQPGAWTKTTRAEQRSRPWNQLPKRPPKLWLLMDSTSSGNLSLHASPTCSAAAVHGGR